MKNPYDDMLHLSPPVSEKYPKMSMQQRAAQFSPFAALTGYEAVIAETGRLTEPLRELDDNRKAVLEDCLQRLERCGKSTITGESFGWTMDALFQSTAFLKFMMDKGQKPAVFPSVFCRSFSFLL